MYARTAIYTVTETTGPGPKIAAIAAAKAGAAAIQTSFGMDLNKLSVQQRFNLIILIGAEIELAGFSVSDSLFAHGDADEVRKQLFDTRHEGCGPGSRRG